MSHLESIDRRNVLAGLVSAGAVVAASRALAQKKDDPKKDDKKPEAHKHEKDAAPPTAVSPALQAVVDSSAGCLSAGRVCLARCTDHLSAGMSSMADCQRAVMNMLAVVEALAETSAYRNGGTKLHKALAAVCGDYCRACAVECEKHAAMHAECKACGEACRACAKACDAYVAEK